MERKRARDCTRFGHFTVERIEECPQGKGLWKSRSQQEVKAKDAKLSCVEVLV